MKIAFATQDLKTVDAHFGWAKNIAIYEISDHGYRFIESVQFNGDLQEDGDEDKLAPKIDAIHRLRDSLCRGDRWVGRGAGSGQEYLSGESQPAHSHR